MQQRLNIGGTRLPVHRQHGHQHQNRAEQCVEEELERSIDPALTTPDTDDQEHRDQHTLEQDVEQDQVKGTEHTDHQGLKHQKGDHVFAHTGLDGFPAGNDADRHKQGRQQNEPDRDTVNAHLVAEAEGRQPLNLLHHLEPGYGRIETDQHEQRDDKGGDRGEQRNPAGIACGRRLIIIDHEEEEHADQRQERND